MFRRHTYPIPTRAPARTRGRALSWLALGALIAGCEVDKPPADTDGTDTDAPAVTCPREPTGDIPTGDANGDGAVDLADVLVVLRHSAQGGVAPVCTDAVDLVADARVELDDAFSLLVHLYEGGFGLPGGVSCDHAEPLPSPACSPVAARFTGTTIELEADALAIEGWSLSVQADGCAVTAATTAGTAGASVVDAPPGLRDLGYDATFVATGGAVSAVVLGFMQPTALPAGAWSPVLALTVEPGDTCDCTLRLGTLTGLGEPVESLVVADGAAWPVTATATIDACAGR